jgi:hypothetical protein
MHAATGVAVPRAGRQLKDGSTWEHDFDLLFHKTK